ncbi:MAG: DUF3987 domain-containing protein [Candidatus Sedimenticola endophacoides]
MYDALSNFRDAIRAAGLEPPDGIEPGKLHRFPGNGKRPSNRAGWCLLFDDGLGGSFGDWSSGLSETWQAKRDKTYSRAERSAFTRRVEEAKRQAEVERSARQADAAKRAIAIWNEATPTPGNHPYLILKRIQPHGARIHKGALTLPVTDFTGRLTSLQFIAADGGKLLLSGGRKRGCFIPVAGDMANPARVILCEGWATGCALAEDEPTALVLAAIDAGNLEPVALAARRRWPATELVIAGDDDRLTAGNPGATKAKTAAIASGALLAPPEDWPELVPLDAPNLPRLDLVHLPGWAGDYARAISADTETPPELAAGMVLVACATAAARRLRVMVKPGYFEPCNLWAVVALPPGNRKSAVQSAATAPLLAWELNQAAIMEAEICRVTSERKTMESRAKEKRSKAAKEKDNCKAAELAREAADIEAELPEIPVRPQIWTSDATPERLGPMMADQDECMAWLSSEGGVFDLLQGRYSNGIPNLDLVLKSHSGDAERVDRGSRPPVFLKSPRLSIGLSPQPDVLRGLAAKPGFRGRGLLGRFLYLLPPSPLGFRPLESHPVPDGVLDAYAAGLRTMLDWEPAIDEHGDERPHLLRLIEEAQSEHHAFAQAIEAQMQPGRELEHFTDWAGKAPGAAARLAGILHGIKHAHGIPWEAAITAETMIAALEIMAVISRHSLAALDMMGADPTIAAARLVWDWTERGRLDRFTVREAFNALRGTFPRVAMLREALEALEERGYLEVIEPPRDGPGRPPSPMVRVRPEIARAWQ